MDRVMLMQLFAWTLYIAGGVLVLLDWMNVLSPAFGWTGVGLMVVGFSLPGQVDQPSGSVPPEK